MCLSSSSIRARCLAKGRFITGSHWPLIPLHGVRASQRTAGNWPFGTPGKMIYPVIKRRESCALGSVRAREKEEERERERERERVKEGGGIK